MSVDAGAEVRRDRWALAALLLAALSELAIAEAYHRFGLTIGRLVPLLAGTALVWGVSWWAGWRPSAPGRVRTSRATVVGAAGLALHVAVLPAATAHVSGGTVTALWSGLAVMGLAVLFVPAGAWARCRPVVGVAVLLFVGGQPLIAWWTAPSFAWPPVATVPVPADGSMRTATIVLLMDELNASDAPAFERALADAGLAVDSARVTSVDRNTIQVVPSLFAGRFSDAKPCSISSVCSDSRVLDFSKVVATRPDIDVVGFYHPYCAIAGLRWCRREGLDLAFTAWPRWHCALWRRGLWSAPANPSGCIDLLVWPWEDLRSRVLRDVEEAPTMTLGGLLFAHVPLPHPPGRVGGTSLSEDYRENVNRASRWVAGLAVRVRQAGLSPRFVIFSDHPLRQENWCEAHVPYRQAGCVPDPALRDTQVPLIVAGMPGTVLPALAGLTDNSRVFSLIGEWPAAPR